MKILMAVMSMGLGGAETHVLELSRALAARGHEVFVASNGGVYADELKKYGVKHEKIPLHSKNPACVAKALLMLSRLMEKERFDIVHAHARIPAFLCGRLKKKYGFGFITTVHFDFYVNKLLRKMSDWGDRALAVSADIAESTAKKYGYPREKIAIVNNGIDTERFSPCSSGESVRSRLGLKGKKIVMYLGRLDEDSFLPAKMLLDAAEEIYREHGNVRVVIVGNGKKYRELSEKAWLINEKLGFELALLPGGTAEPELYIAACDVFVGPSRSALEALSCGKPAVIAGNFGMLGIFSPESAGEALRTNFCCRGSSPATAERIAACVKRIFSLSEPELAEMAAYGREFIERHYSAAAMAELCEAEYAALLAERGKKAVICGYYGAGNVGDEAMLSSLIAFMRKSTNVKKITVISSSPGKTAAIYGVNAVFRGNFEGIERALSESDVLIFGGGNILQDKTSTRSLLYYTHIARLAKKRACRVAFCANGIGPIVHKNNLDALKKALLCADYISMRDKGSLSLARKLTGRADIFASGELAFFRSEKRVSARAKYFAVFPKYAESFDFEELVRFCKSISRKYGLLPLFVPMHASEDSLLCHTLGKAVGGSFCVSFRNVRPLWGSCAFSVCMRLHAAVFSASARVPVIAVSDDIKMASFLSGSGAYVFGPGANAALLCRAAKEVIERSEEKEKLLGKFAEKQRKLINAELSRFCRKFF